MWMPILKALLRGVSPRKAHRQIFRGLRVDRKERHTAHIASFRRLVRKRLRVVSPFLLRFFDDLRWKGKVDAAVKRERPHLRFVDAFLADNFAYFSEGSADGASHGSIRTSTLSPIDAFFCFTGRECDARIHSPVLRHDKISPALGGEFRQNLLLLRVMTR